MKEGEKEEGDKKDCPICCESFTKMIRKVVTCCHCSVDTCVSCVKTYILGFNGPPNCMHCKVGWNHDFVIQNFTAAFMKTEYKIHQQNLLFEIEKAKLPDTQNFVTALEEIKKHGPLVKKITNDFKDDFKQDRIAAKTLDESYTRFRNSVLGFNKEEEEIALQDLKNCIIRAAIASRKRKNSDTAFSRYCGRNYKIYLNNLKLYVKGTLDYMPVFSVLNQCVQGTAPVYRFKCPAENCRGYLNNRNVCGLCLVQVCRTCRCIKKSEENHECDESIVKSVELLTQDSKPCPKCSSLIFKVSGCHQMFCTECATAFDWKTLKISTGPIHNPEYFEWLRRNGKEKENKALGNCVGPRPRFVGFNDRLVARSKMDFMTNLYERMSHIINVDLVKFQFKGVERDPFRFHRIAFLKGEISEEEFKIKIYRDETKKMKMDDTRQILTMFVEVTDDILRDYFYHIHKVHSTRDFLQEFEKIREYTNECLMASGRRYKQLNAYCISYEFNSFKQRISDRVHLTTVPVAG